jgi:hypothetical protein
MFAGYGFTIMLVTSHEVTAISRTFAGRLRAVHQRSIEACAIVLGRPTPLGSR